MRKFVVTLLTVFHMTITPIASSSTDENILTRIKIDETQAQVAPMIYCAKTNQLDCIERVIVEHPDGTIEEARYIETRFFTFPAIDSQPIMYGDVIFEFHNESFKGTTKWLKVATHVQTPSFKSDGKEFGIYWLMLGRVGKPGEDISVKNNCDGKDPATCINFKGLDTSDRFNVYFRTSWLKPVAAGGEGIAANLEYQYLKNGMRWKFSGVEFLQSVFKDSSLLSKSITPNGADLKPDALNPTLYAVIDHAGVDRAHSLWDPTCANSGFTVTINNAPMAGQLFWDYALDSLTFNIYAPHLSATGSTNTGYFYARIPKTWLDCRFPGNTLSTASKVQVQILNEDGTSQVATTSTGIEGNLISIEAAGFHFSSPKIAARKIAEDPGSGGNQSSPLANHWNDRLIGVLTKDEPVVTPNAQTTPMMRTTIICMKGKISKKITGIKPTCPKGFKKK